MTDIEDDGVYPSAPYDFPDWCSRCNKRHENTICPKTRYESPLETRFIDMIADMAEVPNGTAAWMIRERLSGSARLTLKGIADMTDEQLGAEIRNIAVEEGIKVIVVNDRPTI